MVIFHILLHLACFWDPFIDFSLMDDLGKPSGMHTEAVLVHYFSYFRNGCSSERLKGSHELAFGLERVYFTAHCLMRSLFSLPMSGETPTPLPANH